MHHIEDYTGIDFKQHPELYRVGIGEQGVLMAQPYKNEILPYWRFKTPDIALISAVAIYGLFDEYLRQSDFVGADMARKYLQMGFTRSRRYANHATGRKYDKNQAILPQDPTHWSNEKAQAAEIFKYFYDQAKDNPHYLSLKAEHAILYDKSKASRAD